MFLTFAITFFVHSSFTRRTPFVHRSFIFCVRVAPSFHVRTNVVQIHIENIQFDKIHVRNFQGRHLPRKDTQLRISHQLLKGLRVGWGGWYWGIGAGYMGGYCGTGVSDTYQNGQSWQSLENPGARRCSLGTIWPTFGSFLGLVGRSSQPSLVSMHMYSYHRVTR